MKSRVCILAETYAPVVGGGETQARLLAEELTARGYPVTVITRRTNLTHPPRERINGVDVRRIKPVGAGGRKRWGMVPFTFRELWRDRDQFDIVLALGYRALGISAVMARNAFGLPCVFKSESSGELSGEFFRAGLARHHLAPEMPVIRQMIALRNRVLLQADMFVALSTHLEVEFLRAGVRADRMKRIPNGVDTEIFRPASRVAREAGRRELGLSPEHRMIIYTGRLVSYKGLPLLLRVWKDVMQEVPGARLYLVGEAGDDIHGCEDELRSFVADNDLHDHVVFSGAVRDVAPLLQAADIFVLPTENEALPVSLLEAMAVGLACIATPVAGIPDIITDDDNGMMVPMRDAEGLRRALLALLNSPARGAALGRNARETVMDRFSVRAVADAYAELIDTVARRDQESSSAEVSLLS